VQRKVQNEFVRKSSSIVGYGVIDDNLSILSSYQQEKRIVIKL
jgi:hypothetical protein